MVKKTLLSLAIAASTVGLTACNISSTAGNEDVDSTAVNAGKPGFETGSVTPQFRPSKIGDPLVPLNIDILFAAAAATDGTADTADTTPPVTTAINKLAGFSTTAAMYMNFTGALEAESVVAGQSVYLVKLKNANDNAEIDALDIATIAATGSYTSSDQPVAGVDYEVDYLTLDNGNTHTVRILPKKPLDPKTKYVIAFTNGIKSASGNAALASGDTLLIRSQQVIPDALQPLRTLVNIWDSAAVEVEGLNKDNLILSYAFTTNATTDVLHAMAAPATFLESQIPSIAHAEAAISASIIGDELEGDATQEDAEKKAENSLNFLARVAAEATNVEQPGTFESVNGVAARIVLKAAESPIYYRVLISTISKDIDLVVDKPQSRTYTPIISAAATPVAIPYDTFLNAQVALKVDVLISTITIAEEAIAGSIIARELGNGKTQELAETIAENSLNYLAGQTAGAIDDERLAGKNGVSARPILKSEEDFIPLYLAALKETIVSSQVADLSSKGAIYQGGLTIPNYLPAAEAGIADTALGSWSGSNNAALALGLSGAPTDVNGEINVTYRFPFADKVDDSTIPVMVTMPKADCDPDGPGPASGKPADGWPVVIYSHGITVDRSAGLLVGNTLADNCIAMVVIDHAMHGIAPLNGDNEANSLRVLNVEQVAAVDAATSSPFAAARAGWIEAVGAENAPELAALAERHHNVAKAADQSNIDMVFQGTLDSDGFPVTETSVGTSGQLYINLQNFARSRDGLRQTVIDMLNLGASIGDMDVNADGTADDLNPDNLYFIGHSLGGIVGTTFLAVNNDPNVRAYNANLPTIKAAALGNPSGGFAKMLESSLQIGAQVIAGLAAKDVAQGSEKFEKFMSILQATMDSADPINFAAGTQDIPVLVYTDVGGLEAAEGEDDDGGLSDQVVPNNALNPVMSSSKSFLTGTDPLVAAMGITDFVNQTNAVESGPITADPKYYFPNAMNDSIVRANVRFTKGTHSTFSSADPKDVFAETYGQIISFFDPYGATQLLGLPGDQKGFVVQNTEILEAAE